MLAMRFTNVNRIDDHISKLVQSEMNSHLEVYQDLYCPTSAAGTAFMSVIDSLKPFVGGSQIASHT